MLNVSRQEEVRPDPRTAITVPPLPGGSHSECLLGPGPVSAREFIESGGAGGTVGGTVLVGASVERADYELPAGDLARDLLEKAPSENIRRELLEKEGKEKGYDMKLWKKVRVHRPHFAINPESAIIKLCSVSSTFNPQPSTLDPRPSTLDPQPSTLNTQLSTLNPLLLLVTPCPNEIKLQRRKCVSGCRSILFSTLQAILETQMY